MIIDNNEKSLNIELWQNFIFMVFNIKYFLLTNLLISLKNKLNKNVPIGIL